jgi:hypothetical protein
MRRFYTKIAAAYFLAATVFLMLLAALLLLGAAFEVVAAVRDWRVENLLDGVGLLIIGFAVIETAKFIAEEEILREKELRSSTESRRSLTKFITIIVIAASLEALVMVFKTSRTDIPSSIYPAALLVASMLALVALGLYQWLSSRIAGNDAQEERDLDTPRNERSSGDGA